MECHDKLNALTDDTSNELNHFSFIASEANEEALFYHQAMKVEDTNFFKSAMGKEMHSFKDEGIFELTQVNMKLPHNLIIPFVWSFKGKINTVGELIKRKERLCVCRGKHINTFGAHMLQ